MTNINNTNGIISIVTHSGDAHRDEFLACCLALFLHNDITPIFRRNPTEGELNDSRVLVLDVGMRHEPKLNNFDHHQRGRDESPECALSLYAHHCGYSGMFSYQQWYETTKQLDVRGPFAYAKANGMEAFPFQLMSPVEDALLQLFENVEEVPHQMRKLMAIIGQQILENAAKFFGAVNSIGLLAVSMEVDGLPGLLLPSDDTTGMQDYRDHHRPDAAFSVCYDNRGDGWTLYRFNDHPALDFSKLNGLPDIQFAHPGGFIAKTKTRISYDKIQELIRSALV